MTPDDPSNQIETQINVNDQKLFTTKDKDNDNLDSVSCAGLFRGKILSIAFRYIIITLARF